MSFEIVENKLVKYNGTDTDVVIPENVTTIGGYAFADCDTIKTVLLGDNVVEIGDGTFSGSSVEKVTMTKVTGIAKTAFLGCENLKEIDLGSELEVIEEAAFCDCVALESIVVPDTVWILGDEAFVGCTSLKTIEYNGKADFSGANCFEDTAFINDTD